MAGPSFIRASTLGVQHEVYRAIARSVGHTSMSVIQWDGSYYGTLKIPLPQPCRMASKIKRNTPFSPNLRAHVERFIQTLKVECLDKFVIVAQRHLNYVCREFAIHYNRERPHEARDHLPPACESPPEPVETIRPGDVVCTTRLGGLLRSYSRRAA